MTVNLRSGTDKRIPPTGSSIWGAITPPLLDYLSHPRSIDDIIEWAAIRGHTHSSVNNMLAWLSLVGKVRYDDRSTRWRHGSDHQSYLESGGDLHVASRGL